MAIYHFSAQILSRAPQAQADGRERPGSNAVAAAAYRSGERLTDRQTGRAHDYSRRRGVVHSEIMVPEGSADWLRNRQQLWNAVERAEFRRDAQLAREFNMALPHELDPGQRLQLVREFVAREFVGRGMVADVALHDPVDDQNPRNFHAHVMVTLRRATSVGLDAVKTREWNSRDLLASWRLGWEQSCNAALERAGVRARVDRRTLADQLEEARARKDYGRAVTLDRAPECHVGPRARRARRAGDIARVERLRDLTRDNDRRLRDALRRLRRRHDVALRRVDMRERRMALTQSRGATGLAPPGRKARATSQRLVMRAAPSAISEHRVRTLKAMLKLIHQILRSGEQRREAGLIRAREVERWLRRALARGRARDPASRDRHRRKPKE